MSGSEASKRPLGLPSEQLLSAIVANSDDAIVSKDLSGIIMSWNAAAERIFGYSPEEALGRPITLIIPPERHSEEASILARLKAGERIDHYETVRVAKDGRHIDVSLTISPIRGVSGEIVGASKIARDITEAKRQRKALDDALEALKAHSEKLEAAVSERTAELRESLNEVETFSSSIPHDMRGPLRSLAVLLSAVHQDHRHELSPEGQELLTRAMNTSGRLRRFLDNALSYARTRHGKIVMKQVELKGVLSNILSENAHIRQSNAEVNVREPLPAVMGDEGLLTQALWNLVSNACKYVPRGTRPHIEIWCEVIPEENVSPDLSEGEAHEFESEEVAGRAFVRLCVKDNGIGIAKENQEKIFALFERLHSGEGYEGSGVGLAVVQRAAMKMHGTSGVESEPGKGSTFWVQLRAAGSWKG